MPLRVRWEGDFASERSLSIVNREIVSRLDQRAEVVVERGALGEPVGDAGIVVRHGRPVLHPPEGARWVAMQPWEFGSIPRLWFDPFVFQADEIWVYSEFNRQVYLEAGVPPEKVHVIPLGIQDVYLQPPATPFPLKTRKRFRFLFVGGTVQRKGVDLLLAAYRRTFTAEDDVCLVIKEFGSDSFYRGQTSEHHIRELQRDPAVADIEYLTGDVDSSALRDLYHSCHCLVHPYRGEGFGLPIAEAMACGLPVIVPEEGGAAEFCPEGVAIRLSVTRRRVPVKFTQDAATLQEPWWMEVDPRMLGERMREVTSQPEDAKSLGQRAQAWIRPRFTWKRTAQAILTRLEALSGVEVPLAKDAARQAELFTRIGARRWEEGNADAALRYFAHALERERTVDHLYNVAAVLLTRGDRGTSLPLLAELEGRLAESGENAELLGEVRGALAAGGPDVPVDLGHMQLRWYAPLYNPSGYAHESRNFLFGVREGCPLEIRVEALDHSWQARVVTSDEFRTLEMLSNRTSRPVAVDFQHCPPNFFQTPQGVVSIARTMFETDRISAEWVERCNQFTEVWVPTDFNRETFARSGVVRDKIRVVPGCLDVEKYDRARLHRYPLATATGFRFISVFDFSPRKGWDVLLDAYLREFSSADDVCLVVKVMGVMAGDQPPARQVEEFVRRRGLRNLPELVFIDDELAEADLLALYASCDAFVLPSRGEGWGRPYMEAMALGMPTIGTRWSANLAFMNDANSFLIDIDGLEPCENRWDNPDYRGHQWAVPNVDALRRQMRLVFEDRAEAARRGQAARREIVDGFDRPVVARRFLDQLAAACRHVDTEVAL